MRLVLCLCLFTVCEILAINNFLGTDLQKCLNCLCHARTGCFSRRNCAKYSINLNYWKTANRPIVDLDDHPDDNATYEKCMNDENCILATITGYADAIGHMDCNCDGKFDCEDRMAIHFFGRNCSIIRFNRGQVRRYNSCVRALHYPQMEVNFEECVPEIVEAE